MKELQLMCYKRGNLPGPNCTDPDSYEYCSIAENEPNWADRHAIIAKWLNDYAEFYDVVIQQTHDEDYHPQE